MPTLPLFRDGADYRLAQVEIGGPLHEPGALAQALAVAGAYGHRRDVAQSLALGQAGRWPVASGTAARQAADAATWQRAIAEASTLETWLCGPDVRPDLVGLLRDITALGLAWRCLLPETDFLGLRRRLCGLRLPTSPQQRAEALLASLGARRSACPVEWALCGSLPGPPLVLHAKLDRHRRLVDEVAISAGDEVPQEHVHACQRLLRHGPGVLRAVAAPVPLQGKH